MVELPRSRSGKTCAAVAAQVVGEAAKILLQHFPQEKHFTLKGRANIVTEVDVLVEKAMEASLQEEFPGFGLLGEESGEAKGETDYTWVLDPLDGTRNYAWGIPYFAVNLALLRGEEILLGVTYDPVRDEYFWAQKGAGAFVNGEPSRVSQRRTLEEAVLGLDVGYDDEKGRLALELIASLWPGVAAVRIMGSAALGLAAVAAGRLDLYIHQCLYPWDVAPGFLLIPEAGGVVTERDGRPVTLKSMGLVAANPALHAAFMARVQGHPWQRG